MIETGLHISSSLSTVWLPWICLAMVGLVWLSCIMQPQYLRGILSNSFASFSVNAAEQVPSIGSQVAQWLFNSTVPALCVYVLVTDAAMDGTELLGELIVMALTIDALRAITALVVQYTFRLGKMMGLAYMRYFSLRTLLSFVMLVVVLLVAYTSPDAVWGSILAGTVLVYIVILGLQWTKIFCNQLTDIAGVVIYLITVELLPLMLLYEAGIHICLQQYA
ncbi:MAG: DUF4271 domain-containing protein [Paludibacteraceae bacterium]|nr:DUF4271 domain-containing protein [Paludibacteraceae bacterium]